MNKIISTILLLLLPIASFADVTVFHFNSQTTQFDPMIIHGMDKVADFFVAGKYTWAVDYDNANIAFYNGESWSQAQHIEGMAKIYGLVPGYEDTGKKPIAWLDGFTDDANIDISAYFDGNKWITLQNPNNETYLQAASGGKAWFTDYKDLYIRSDDNPLQFAKYPYKQTNSLFDTNDTIIATGDENANALMIADQMNRTDAKQLYSIDAFGNSKPLAPLFTQTPSDENHYYFSRYKNEILLKKLSDSNGYWYSRDNGNSWRYHTDSISEYSYGGIMNGKVCAKDNNHNDYRHFICFDASSEKNKSWVFDYSDIPNSHSYETQLFSAAPDRMWVTMTVASDTEIKAYSSYLDFETGKRYDTDLTNHAIIVYDAIALGNKRMLACGIDQAFKTVALYYDGNTWTSTKLNDDIMAKCITNTSYAINSSYSETGNVWFYPDEKYTGSNSELRKLVMRRSIKHNANLKSSDSRHGHRVRD